VIDENHRSPGLHLVQALYHNISCSEQKIGLKDALRLEGCRFQPLSGTSLHPALEAIPSLT
jgi:hypothetical protein